MQKEINGVEYEVVDQQSRQERLAAYGKGLEALNSDKEDLEEEK